MRLPEGHLAWSSSSLLEVTRFSHLPLAEARISSRPFLAFPPAPNGRPLGSGGGFLASHFSARGSCELRASSTRRGAESPVSLGRRDVSTQDADRQRRAMRGNGERVGRLRRRAGSRSVCLNALTSRRPAGPAWPRTSSSVRFEVQEYGGERA